PLLDIGPAEPIEPAEVWLVEPGPVLVTVAVVLLELTLASDAESLGSSLPVQQKSPRLSAASQWRSAAMRGDGSSTRDSMTASCRLQNPLSLKIRSRGLLACKKSASADHRASLQNSVSEDGQVCAIPLR